MDLTCPTCFRLERREPDSVVVVTPGGSRRPSGHAVAERWATLARALRGALPPIVADCPCGQFLVGTGPWTDVDIPEIGVSTRGGQMVGVTVAEAVARVRKDFAPVPWYRPNLQTLHVPLIFLVLVGPIFLMTFSTNFVLAYITWWWHSWTPDYYGY